MPRRAAGRRSCEEEVHLANRLSRHFGTRSAGRGYDGDQAIPVALHGSPTFVPRLSFKLGDLAGDYSALAKSIEGLPGECTVYLDANVWDVSLGPDVWRALTTTRGRVVVTPLVLMELGAWSRSHPGHDGVLGFRARQGQDPALEVELPLDPTSTEGIARAYYTHLLWIRRLARRVAEDRLRDRGQSTPTVQAINTEIQKTLGDRGLLLVHKRGKSASPGKATDEDLVYSAAASALKSGQGTIVLTRDDDLAEQFYKLWWFLDTHYRGMLMGDEYSANPFAYRHHALPVTERTAHMFTTGRSTMVERGPRRMQEVLPADFDFVAAECWVVKPAGMTKLVFGAERQMARLLDVKGRTGGLSTEMLDGRNIHPWLAGLNIGRRVADSYLVAPDKTVEIPGRRHASASLTQCIPSIRRSGSVALSLRRRVSCGIPGRDEPPATAIRCP